MNIFSNQQKCSLAFQLTPLTCEQVGIYLYLPVLITGVFWGAICKRFFLNVY